MAFSPVWTKEAADQFQMLQEAALGSLQNRQRSKKAKASKSEGLFKLVHKTIELLLANPPSLSTHEYDSIEYPYDRKKKAYEAYAQNNTPGAYRIFWCHGPDKTAITILAITPHP